MTWESGATTWFCESGFEEEFAWGKTTMMMRGKEERRSGRACVEIRRTKTGCGGEEILITRYYGPRYDSA